MKYFSRNVRNYLIALAVLVICASAYRGAATQFLSLPDIAVVTPRPPTQNVSLKENLADLFPQEAWQLSDCKRLLTGNGALLFQNWRQVSEDQWKLWPLTIVVGRGLSNDAAEAPIILTAKEGAEVQFAQSLDMMGGSAPPIRMGRMIGDVFIDRKGKSKPGESLSVKTRNVRIDNQKVWTTEEISMKVGEAELRGRDLTIYLAASAASAAKAETPSTILDRMDLVYLEELRIPLDRSTPDPSLPRRIGVAATSQENGVVSIRCKNGLVYDFALDRLSLRDSITMVRSIRSQVLDRFDCDTLDLVLRDPADRNVQRLGPLDWIDRVHATGRPAVIKLSSYNFQIDADDIDFDAIGGLLRAEGERGVQLARGPIIANLARLAYQFNPDAPEEIGAIDVLGPGEVTVNEPGIMLRRLSWSEGFKLQPIGRATLDAVKNMETQSKLGLRVDGDVRATLSDGGSATAGSVEGVLKPHYFDEPISQPVQHVAYGTVVQPSQKVERKMTLLPEFFRATDAVSITSNEVIASMNQLSLFFEQAADLGKRASTPSMKNGLANSTAVQPPTAASGEPGSLAGWISQPASAAGLRTPVARKRPELSGDLVSAKLLITPNGIQPKDVSIDGDVRVKHQVTVGETLLPVEMTGDTMRLLRSAATQASGQDYLQLGSGPESPARLTMGDGFFRGPVIKVWPSDNVVQVAGAGELRIPSEVLKKNEATAIENSTADASEIGVSSVDWTAPPYCRWGGSMQFNGQVALLGGGVQIDAELVSGTSPWVTSMTGEEMQISLSQPIQLMDRSTMANAELAEISLVQSENRPVVVRAEQRSIDQATQAIHMITANRLDFSPGNGGQLVGTGPGWYRGWMLTDQKNSVLSPRAAASEHLAGQVLQGVHLTFRNSMRGDLNSESLAFDGGVRTGVQKLQSWDDSVDVAQMERLDVGEMTMNCQRLQFGISPGMPDDLREIPGMPTPWEMTAEGGVVVRTNTENRGLIEGTANRASFESTKSWLIVEGAPGRSAQIRQTKPDGTPGANVNYPRMAVNLKTYAFEMLMQDAKVNDLPQPPSR